jgi:hypothetical protein
LRELIDDYNNLGLKCTEFFFLKFSWVSILL